MEGKETVGALLALLFAWYCLRCFRKLGKWKKGSPVTSL